MEAHILVAEDEARLRTIIRDYFTAHGLTCALAKDGEEALERLRERDYDAVLLDVLMPNLDGFAVCRAVREGSGVPILFLTALGGEKDVLRGYALGADDYVTKPFSLAVLLAKTEALIRRSRGGGAETLACGAITLEPGRRACTVGGRLVALPPREYELLLCLMRNKGQVLRREQLLDKVWGIDFEGGDRAVDGRIKVLRAALGPAGKQIRTFFKVGYMLEGEQQGADWTVVQRDASNVFSPLAWDDAGAAVAQFRGAERTHGGIYAVVPVVCGVPVFRDLEWICGGEKKAGDFDLAADGRAAVFHRRYHADTGV